MGFLDKAKAAASSAVGRHGHKIAKGMDRAGEVIDKQTGHRHTAKIVKGKAKAKEALDRLDDPRDPH